MQFSTPKDRLPGRQLVMAKKEPKGPASQPRQKTWVSSEKRQRSTILGLRLLPEERRLLDEEAQRRGLRSTQELVLDHLKSVLTAAS